MLRNNIQEISERFNGRPGIFFHSEKKSSYKDFKEIVGDSSLIGVLHRNSLIGLIYQLPEIIVSPYHCSKGKFFTESPGFGRFDAKKWAHIDFLSENSCFYFGLPTKLPCKDSLGMNMDIYRKIHSKFFYQPRDSSFSSHR